MVKPVLRPARLSGLLLIAAFLSPARADDLVIAPRAQAVSQPVPVNEVQSAVFWVHPTATAKSLLLITNERRGLEVHDVSGLLLKHLNDGCRPCYVDVLYDFPIQGRTVDLALASCMAPDVAGVKVWRIDAGRRKLVDLTSAGALKVFDGRPPIGLCTYHSRRTGKCFIFVTLRAGEVEQYELVADEGQTLAAQRVRAFRLKGEIKSCIADDETGFVYVAEDAVGIWRYDAEPEAAVDGACVIRVGEHGLVPNVKGPAIYHADGGKGYLLVVSQGAKGGHTCIKVYERQGDNDYVLTIEPSAEPFGPIDHCSGLAVTNSPTAPGFSEGALAVNDQINPNASEDFKIFSWGELARQGKLLIDTSWQPRWKPPAATPSSRAATP